jgi:hypothetical protein
MIQLRAIVCCSFCPKVVLFRAGNIALLIETGENAMLRALLFVLGQGFLSYAF